MAELTQVPHPPSINRNEFNCPHCGAHSNQTWFKLAADPIERDGTPSIPDSDLVSSIKADRNIEEETRENILRWAAAMASGLVFVDKERAEYWNLNVYNLYLSRCFTCKKMAVWVHDTLLFPSKRYVVPPNPDLPDDIKRDYEEASNILESSPRGAAALLRLAIQERCVHLKESGKNINDDIASLVKRGLDKRVQQALDVVRVVGNNAVHPGQMDMKDNRDTARTLFGLINIISEKMISEPKHVQSIFDSLPEGARKQIEKRDS